MNRRTQLFEDFVTVFAVLAVIWVYRADFAAVGDSFMPEPVAESSCSCAYKKNCKTAIFMVDDNRRAYCAFCGKRTHCCMVETARD